MAFQQIDLPSFRLDELLNIIVTVSVALGALALIFRSLRKGSNRMLRWILRLPEQADDCPALDRIGLIETQTSELARVIENGLTDRMERVEAATATLTASVAELHGKIDTLIRLDR